MILTWASVAVIIHSVFRSSLLATAPHSVGISNCHLWVILIVVKRAGIDLSLLKHISPVGWENITLYGEYVLNPNLIR